jgi:hypothetical protein
MSEASAFYPSRKKGLIVHTACLLAFSALSSLAMFFSLRQEIGAYFVLLLLAALLLFAPLPLLAYQAYALMKARYRLDRDGLHLRWGMRAEDIPLEEVEWVRPADELPIHIPAPRPSLPGALTGTVTVEGLGPVEFLAAGRTGLLLIATPHKIFAITPVKTQEFLSTFQDAFEMGSLQRISAQSVLPAAFLAQVWSDRAARWMLIAAVLLTLLLFVGISLAVPGREQISLGFYPDGRSLPPAPAAQILLLPVLGLMFFIVDLAAGLFFYRIPAYRTLGYLVWGSSIATSLLLAGAALWIL